jgi:co-chaperonin GroES (HSP10)
MLQYELSQASPNSLIVEIGAQYDDTVQYGSLSIFIDPLFKPTHNARIYGLVKAIPKGKCYNEDGIEIEADVKVGDKVYFHYLATFDENACLYGNYYRIPYCWVFCVVRGTDIIPIGGWTFCEKMVEGEEEFSEVEVNGVKISAVTNSSGLVTSIGKNESTKVAIMRHIGKPLKNINSIEVNSGEKVLIEKSLNFENTIEGKSYYTIRQGDILGQYKTFSGVAIVAGGDSGVSP